MIFSYNWLKDYVLKLPKPEKLADLLTTHFAEVEEVEKLGKDYTLDIDIRPNRASDAFSHLGLARECSAITGLRLKIPEVRIVEDRGVKAKDRISVDVKGRGACFRYTARVVSGVKVGPSPGWLQERLASCGLRPINNIVDATNYVMLETGQPLHAFDGEKLEGGKIIVRAAKEKEKIITLDEEKYDLDEDVLVIADANQPVALAGIKGGKAAEIGKGTKTVVLESANFNPQVVRRGSKKIDLKTDASLRFEHGLDPNLTEFAVNRAAGLVQEISGGKVAQGLVDVYPKKVLPKIIKLDLNYLEKMLGIKVPSARVKSILNSLNFKVVGSSAGSIKARVPTVRLDVSIPEDLVEEIGRIYGYEKIPTVFPLASLAPPERNLDIFWEDMAKNILKEAGFVEVYNYSFVSEQEARSFSLQNLIEVENPLSLEQKYLRPSLIPGLLKNVQANEAGSQGISIFELGKVFENGKKSKETRSLSGVISGETFYRGKGIVDLLLNKMGISSIWYDEYQATTKELPAYWGQAKGCAEIKADGKSLGFLGEVSLRVLNKISVKSKLIYFDIDFDKLSVLASEEHEYRPLSRFPAAIRDLAVLVPLGTKVVELLNVINIAGGKLVRDVDLFDIYEGEELPQGRKNLAFRIIYQAEDRTLSPPEIEEIQKRIIKALEKNPDWQVRK